MEALAQMKSVWKTPNPDSITQKRKTIIIIHPISSKSQKK
jgi:hypothetical protein